MFFEIIIKSKSLNNLITVYLLYKYLLCTLHYAIYVCMYLYCLHIILHSHFSGQIENQKLDYKVESKVGSLDNVKHKPGGGDVKIFDDKDYIKQVVGQSPLPPSHGQSRQEVRPAISGHFLYSFCFRFVSLFWWRFNFESISHYNYTFFVSARVFVYVLLVFKRTNISGDFDCIWYWLTNHQAFHFWIGFVWFSFAGFLTLCLFWL